MAARPIPIYKRWVEEFLRFYHDRTGRWIHPQEMGEREVEAFLTHLAVNRRVAESTQNQALGAILAHPGAVDRSVKQAADIARITACGIVK